MSLGMVSQEVFLQPIEIRVFNAGLAFPSRHAHRPNHGTIGFGALQKRYMLHGIVLLQSAEQVLEHLAVGFYLDWIRPPIDQPGQLKNCGIDNVGNALKIGTGVSAVVRVL